jgi:hypothetical protein
MTATFGNRDKRKLNRVMDAMGFDFLDYEKSKEEVGGVKGKGVVSIMKRQSMRSVQDDKKKAPSKKRKVIDEGETSQLGTKSPAPKKRKPLKVGRAEKKMHAPPKQVPETPSTSSIGVTKILEVMTRPFPFAMLSPLGSDLTSLLQIKDKDAEEGTGRGPSGAAMEETANESDNQLL